MQVGDQQYIDGDEAAPVPIRAARALGAKFVIAVDVSAFEADTPPGVPQEWIEKDFIPVVQQRGAAVIKARGLSSAASAASAAVDHMHDWALGSNGKWVTMGIPSNGDYGIPKDVMFGYPVTTAGGEYKLVEGLEIDAFSQERINLTLKELQEEQQGVAHLL